MCEKCDVGRCGGNTYYIKIKRTWLGYSKSCNFVFRFPLTIYEFSSFNGNYSLRFTWALHFLFFKPERLRESFIHGKEPTVGRSMLGNKISRYTILNKNLIRFLQFCFLPSFPLFLFQFLIFHFHQFQIGVRKHSFWFAGIYIRLNRKLPCMLYFFSHNTRYLKTGPDFTPSCELLYE